VREVSLRRLAGAVLLRQHYLARRHQGVSDGAARCGMGWRLPPIVLWPGEQSRYLLAGRVCTACA
jgi:hypothetical protein